MNKYIHSVHFKYMQVHTTNVHVHTSTIIYCLSRRWTAAELKKVAAMLQNPELCSRDIGPDLHQRMTKAVDDGRIKCFNLLEGPSNGDQDLNLWVRDLEDVVREIVEDPIFKGNQNFHFDMDLDELGKRLFGGKANAEASFQIGQLRYIPLHDQFILVHTSTF
jgi:hypothetical protein